MIQTINKSDIQTIFTNFCREENFKTYVREAINSEFFWRDILHTYQLDSHIESKVKNTVPDLVKNQTSNLKNTIKESVDKFVTEKLEAYTKSQLPGNLAIELNNQIPLYLNNNHHMRQILDSHIQQLTFTLYSSAKETLDKLTNEEKYQSITTSHINNMTIRNSIALDAQLQQNSIKFADQVSSYDDQINSTISTIIRRAEQSMYRFDEFNSTVTTLKNRIDTLEHKIIEINHASTINNWVYGLFGTGLAGFCLYVNFNK